MKKLLTHTHIQKPGIQNLIGNVQTCGVDYHTFRKCFSPNAASHTSTVVLLVLFFLLLLVWPLN